MSTRSDRVLEQLQDTWESLQKDLDAAQAQLTTVKDAKAKSDQQGKDYVESNQDCRSHIQQLMKVLETKELALEHTRQQSSHLEDKVKELKEEAMASRKQMEALKKQEQQLARDRDQAVSARNLVAQQKQALQQAIDHMDSRSNLERTALMSELKKLQHLVQQTYQQYQWSLDLLAQPPQQQQDQQDDPEQQKYLDQVKSLQQKQHDLTQSLVQDIELQVGSLLDNLNQSTTLQDDVQDCRNQAAQLIQKIQTFAKLNLSA
ncbi:hypothetical protein DM01DRAFT_1404319 [Hesseltinella vesiculosa]|uniref:SWI5-dependent HO expression protein 3 n=1 Tax=Hesseltinella vesiculosa TaxID=101127 RepID=A0A1X2GVE9_9FUNG|nr:hypothetical protein DM01DRAFT_1404319 [Hesseltinella vesiculosa]